MVYRNGLVADTLRAAGMDCYHIIFGLNLPQLSSIAAQFSPDIQLAQALWADAKVRESRLLATYLYPREQVSREHAIELMSQTQTQEEADMLAFRLLRYLPFLAELKQSASGYSANALARY